MLHEFMMGTLLVVISISPYILELGARCLILRGTSQPEAVQCVKEKQIEIHGGNTGGKKKKAASVGPISGYFMILSTASSDTDGS